MRRRRTAADKLLGEAVEQRFGHENAAGRDAALAARLECADERAVDGQIEPGVGADDDGALAAHLASGDTVVKRGGNFLNVPADLVAAGEQDDVDVGVADERFADLAGAVNQVEDAGREAGFDEQFDQALADGRRVFGRLEDGGVAFEETRPEHPQRHGEGEVPGRDDGDDAPRLAAHEGVFFGDFGGEYVADRHPAGAEDVLNHVQAFDDLGPALA